MTDAEDQPAEPRAAPPGGRDWRRWALRGKRSGLLAAVVAVAVAFGPMALAPWRERTAEVELPPAVADPHPVRVAVAESKPIRAWVFAEGTSRSVRREYLTFNQSGRVETIADGPGGEPLRAGDPVKAGDVLAELDTRTFAADLDAAKASVDEAKSRILASAGDAKQAGTQFTLAKTKYERQKQSRAQGASSQADLDEAVAAYRNAQAAEAAAKADLKSVAAGVDVAEARIRQAEVVLEETRLVSPIDGVLADLNVEEGFYFTPNLVQTTGEEEALASVPMVVIDPSGFEVTVDVPAFDSGRLAVGQKVLLLPGGTAGAAITAAALDEPVVPDADDPRSATDWRAIGEVYSINPAVNPGGRSVRIKIRTTAGAEALRDGMFVTCWVAADAKPDAVVVPPDVMLYAENEPYVFAVLPGGGGGPERVERRSVVPGVQGLTERELRSGVRPGDRLVTDGRYRLTDGAPVTVLDAAPGDAPR